MKITINGKTINPCGSWSFSVGSFFNILVGAKVEKVEENDREIILTFDNNAVVKFEKGRK